MSAQISKRVFLVEYSFTGERWAYHAPDGIPNEFTENERWYGEEAVDRVMRAAYGTRVRWRWVEKPMPNDASPQNPTDNRE